MNQKSTFNIEKVKDLNDICTNKKTGLYKQWIYKKNDYIKMCNYMQKINYSIQDLNLEIEIVDNLQYKDVVFIISLVDWIKEAYEKIYNSIKEDVKNCFVFSKEIELQKAKQYLQAIRSFIVGHPLNTTRHKKFGFDGDFICVDVRNKNNTLNLFSNKHYYKIDYDGLSDKKSKDVDFYLYCYSDKEDGMKYFRFISCQMKDVYNVARIYIEKLYELNKYLCTKKKKDFGEENE